MTVRATLIDPRDGKALEVQDFDRKNSDVDLDSRVLVTMGPLYTASTFKSVTAVSAGTVVLTSPSDKGSLIIVDLVISTERTNGGTVTVQWNDGTEQVQIFTAIVTDAPANLSMSFGGRVQGWQDARLEVVTGGSTTNTVFASYAKTSRGLPFAEWDELR